MDVLLFSLLLLLSPGTSEGSISAEQLQEALDEGFRRGAETRDFESILGLQLRSGSPLDSASTQLFNFRRPEPQAKTSSACLATSLLEVSKYLIKKLPGTTVEGVTRLQQQRLQSATCRRLLTQAGGDCSNVRVGQLPRCVTNDPYRSLDGSCNNIRRPEWGSSGRAFSRYLRPYYEDGLDEPRGGGRPPATSLPSARKVSTVMSEGVRGRVKPLLSITSLVMQFGQFIDHDLTHTPESAVSGEGNTLLPFGCCERGVPPSLTDQRRVPDCRPIDLRGDQFFDRLGRSCMRFVRSLVADNGCKLGPRQQLNQVTSFLDASVLYGTSKFLSNHLRDQRSRGQLRHTNPRGSSLHHGKSCPGSFCNSALLPEQRCHAQTTQSCFISGDGRANEQPGLTSLHILFMRIHNSVAADLAVVNPRWSSDTVYQEARRIVVALLQQVTYRELLPVVLGSAPMDHFSLWLNNEGYFTAYNNSIDPSTPNVFATAAFRFGHSLVDDVLMQGAVSNITLLNSFNQPTILKQPGTRPSQFLQSITDATSQVSDEYMVPTLTNNLFGSTRFPVGLDLYALNTMRGRDHGLASYNEWRSACGLPRAASFGDLASFTSIEAMNKFRNLYKSVDDIDLFPAAMSEAPLGNGILGPTFACLIGQHFHDLKLGDRYWHENLHQPKPFTNEQLQELRTVWFASLLCHHTNIDVMQPSPFLAPDRTRNVLQSCPSYKKLDLRMWKEGVGTIGVPPTTPPSTTQRPVTRPPTTHRPVPPTAPPTVRPTTTSRPQTPPWQTEAPPVTSKPIAVSPIVTASPPIRPQISTRPPVRPQISTRPPVTVRPPSVAPPQVTVPPKRPIQPDVYPITSTRPDPNRPQVHPTGATRPPDLDRPQVHPTVAGSQKPLVFPQQPTTQRPSVFPAIGYPSLRPTTTKRPIIQQAAYYPPPIAPPFSRVCRAVGVWGRLPGMDRWCTNNCYHPGSQHCPPSHCSCL